MALDYGERRTGVAVTDPFKIIATPHSTIPTSRLKEFIHDYHAQEGIEILVIGQPTRHDGSFSSVENNIELFIEWVKSKVPDIQIDRINEMYTSKEAVDALIQSGTSKKQRRDKGLIDRTSATIMLQEYMEQL
jgi:putative Holliday junction resolvase